MGNLLVIFTFLTYSNELLQYKNILVEAMENNGKISK